MIPRQYPIREIPYNGNTYHSRAEVAYAWNCDARGLFFRREPWTVPLMLLGREIGVRYRPDFIHDAIKLVVEVKGPNIPGAEKPLIMATMPEFADWSVVILKVGESTPRVHALRIVSIVAAQWINGIAENWLEPQRGVFDILVPPLPPR
jgi:hypothetical protein